MARNTIKRLNELANKVLASERVLSAIEAQEKLGVNSLMAYAEIDSFIGKPESLLGRVLMIRKKDGKCPQSFSDKDFDVELIPQPIPSEVDPDSRLKQPNTRGAIIVDKTATADISLLSYLSASLSANSVFSIVVTDQATGLLNVHAPSWKEGLNQWLSDKMNITYLNDPNVCYLYVIVGFIRKDVTRKEYLKLDAKGQAGAFAVNVNGEIHTSTENYYTDVRFGLTPVVLKSPSYNILIEENRLADASLKKLSDEAAAMANYLLPKAEETVKLSSETMAKADYMPQTETQKSLLERSKYFIPPVLTEMNKELELFRGITHIGPVEKNEKALSTV